MDTGKIDIFIDDFIGVAPDIGETPSRVVRAIPLAIRTLARPLSQEDIIPRKDIISLKKLQAEGQLSEVKIILGWEINTRLLTIALPVHKATAWTNDIETIIEAGRANYKTLESLLGRLNHIACILSPMRHFLGRLYRAMYRAKARRGWTVLSPNELQDLGLQADFISLAKSGLSLNNVSYNTVMVVNTILMDFFVKHQRMFSRNIGMEFVEHVLSRLIGYEGFWQLINRLNIHIFYLTYRPQILVILSDALLGTYGSRNFNRISSKIPPYCIGEVECEEFRTNRSKFISLDTF